MKHLRKKIALIFTSVLFACTGTSGGQQKISEKITIGNTWAPVALNKEAETVSAFLIAKNGRLIAGTSAGLMLSDDKGLSWKTASVNPDYKAAVFSLAKDDAGNIYAGLSKYGVLTSADNGATWNLTAAGLNMGGPRTSYAMLAGNGCVFKGTYESGLYRSTDKGRSWVPNNNGIPLNLLTNRMVSVTQLVLSNNTIYALTDLGVRWSADNGKTFNKPAHNGIEKLSYMTCIAVDGKNLFCGATSGTKGVFTSADNGENWKIAGLGGKAVYAITVINGKLITGADGAIYTSADLGKTWIPTGTGLPANAVIYAIGITTEGKLLAGLNRGGIYLLK